MKRRAVLSWIGGTFLGMTACARAQSAKIPRIGFLRTTRPPQSYIDAFEKGLVGQGYTPGKTILIEYRFAGGNLPELDRLAREIVDSKVDVIVAGGGLATRAAMRATSTIPIAMTSASDPVGTGLVASLSRPGGNVSGTSIVSWDLFAKRLELLKQMLPNVTHVAVLINRNNPAPANGWDNALESARTLGIALQRIDVTAIAEFEDAFETMRKGRAEALLVVQSNIFETPPFPIQQLALTYRIPAMYGLRTSTDAGGLISYGPNVRELYEYAAVFVAKFLRGVKPADLPVEQPTKIELVINLQTAKRLGMAIPQSLLLRADDLLQ